MDTSIRKLKQFILNWKISVYLVCFSSKRNTRLHEKIRFNHKQYYLYCNIISHFYYYYHRLYVFKLALSKNYKARVIVSTLTVAAFTVKTEFQDNQLINDIAGCIFDLNITKNLNFFQILRFLLVIIIIIAAASRSKEDRRWNFQSLIVNGCVMEAKRQHVIWCVHCCLRTE